MSKSLILRIAVVAAFAAASVGVVTQVATATHGSHTLQVHAERTFVDADGVARPALTAHLHGGGLLGQDTPAGADVWVDFEVLGGAADTDGNSALTSPERTCKIPAGQSSCSLNDTNPNDDTIADEPLPARSATGSSLVRAWIDHDNNDATVEADPTEARLADKDSTVPPASGTDCEEGQDGNQASCESGTADDGVVSEPDITDVVEVNYTTDLAILDCAPESQSVNNLDSAKITCSALASPGNEGVSGIRIDGENMTGSVNDPDDGGNDQTPGTPGTENDADYELCTTGSDGTCSGFVPASEGQQGIARLCFWTDRDNLGAPTNGNERQYEDVASANHGESDGTSCGSSTSDTTTGNLTDKVTVNWNSDTTPTTSTSTTTTTTAPTTTTTAPTTTTTAPTTTTTTAPTTTTTTAPTTTTAGPTTTTTTAPTTTTAGPTTTTTQPPPPAAPSVRTGGAGSGDKQMWLSNGFDAPFRAHGGVLASGPALTAAKSGTGTMVPVEIVTGTDNALYVRRDISSDTFHRLSNQATFCIGAPGALVYRDTSNVQKIIVGCRGSDNALWYAIANQNGDQLPLVNGWQSLGGILEAGPGVGIVNGKVTFAVVGQGGRIYINDTLTAGNNQYKPTSWLCIGRPAIGSKPQAQLAAATGTAYFGCHGTDHKLWISRNTSGTWGPTFNVGGILREGVSAAVSDKQAVFFVRGNDDGIYRTRVFDAHPTVPFDHENTSRIAFDPGAVALT